MQRERASLAVLSESAKCRSGRERDLSAETLPSALGGKAPDAFGNQERKAAQDDRNMVVPTAIAPAFEMVEPELALQVLVNAFGPPALLEQTQKLFSRSVLVDGGDVEFVRCCFTFFPLDDQSHNGALGQLHFLKREAGAQGCFAPLSPCETTVAVLLRELIDADALARPTEALERAHACVRINAEEVLEAMRANLRSKRSGASVE